MTGHAIRPTLQEQRRISQYVLVVDDDADGRELLSEYLTFRGMRVRSASNGQEALSVAFAEPPAVVLMDLAMPHSDGYNAIRHLKADVRTKDVVVVAVSAHAFPAERTKAIAEGADAFVPKPFDLILLGEVVTSILSIGREALGPLHDIHVRGAKTKRPASPSGP